MVVKGVCLLAVLVCAALPGWCADRALDPVADSPKSTGARVALVIGNAAYKSGALRNPVNDATDMAAALRECGFEVTLKTDCDLKTMGLAADGFGERIKGCGAALFYYAGHGIQSQGENFLVPVDADLQAENEARYVCLQAGRILAKMENAGAAVNIMILDACRDNPFARKFRGMAQGLASMEAVSGTLVAFATGANTVAADGDGRNGVYTGCLLKHLRVPGVPVVEVFTRVRIDVRKATNNAQTPCEYQSLTGSFYFVPGTADAPPPPPPPPPPVMTGNLQVAVNAPKAKVTVDGKAVGEAALDKALEVKDLPSGKVKVEVSAEGYEPLSKVVEIKRGDWTQEAFELAKVIVLKSDKPHRPPTVVTPETRVPKEPQPGEMRVFEGGEFVWIPPGTFQMGNKLSPERIAATYGGNEQFYRNAEPRHTVTISKGFWLGRCEVTCQDFEAFVKVAGYKTDAEKEGWGFGWNKTTGKWEKTDGLNWRDSGWTTEAKQPVVVVSWNDATAYCEWLSKKSGESYGLPTEAQWEYACRAGTETEFWWGDSADDGKGCLNAAGLEKGPDGQTFGEHFNFDDGYWFVAPAGSFRANAWGLHDMHGNVWEWCQDWYGAYSAGPATDPAGASSGTLRVVRGGSWNDLPGYSRSALRNCDPPAAASASSGSVWCCCLPPRTNEVVHYSSLHYRAKRDRIF